MGEQAGGDPVMDALKKSKQFKKHGSPRKVPGYYQYIMEQVNTEGLWLDFCIGSTNAVTQHIVPLVPAGKVIYGFDWFRGLPEMWSASSSEKHEVGKFAAVNSSEAVKGFATKLEKKFGNLRVVTGLIEETLPVFVEEHKENCAFIHFDCDIYRTTATILNCLRDRIVSGTVLAFDEFWGFENYRQCEYRAFMEFIEDKQYEFIAYVDKRQAAVKIL